MKKLGLCKSWRSWLVSSSNRTHKRIRAALTSMEGITSALLPLPHDRLFNPDTFDPMRRRRDGVMTNYRDRERFFNEDDWPFEEDFDQDCQSTRQEMLILTSKTEVRYTNPRNCVVRTGEWLDEYTGKTFTVAVQIDIDHVISRMYAHTMAVTDGCQRKNPVFQRPTESHAGRQARNSPQARQRPEPLHAPGRLPMRICPALGSDCREV